MQNQAEKRITTFIAAGYALVIALVIALALLAISGMHALHSATRNLYEHPFKVNTAALEATSKITLIRDDMLLIGLSDDPEQIGKLSSEILPLDDGIRAQMAIIKESFLGDMQRVVESENLLNAWQELRSREIDLAMHAQHNEAIRIMEGPGAELFSRLNNDLGYITDFSRQRANIFVAESEHDSAALIRQTWWFLAALITTISLASWAVVRRVLWSVRSGEQFERKLQEIEHQARSAAYARSLIEASLDPLVTISPDGKITDVNQATETATGKHRSELIGTDFSDYFTEPDKARAGYRQVFSRGYVTDYPLAIRHQDGHIMDVLYNASIYHNETGAVSGVFAAARDVTELKQSSQYARSLIEASLDPLVTISQDGKITDVNEATIKVTGKHREELIGTDFSDYFTEPDLARVGYQEVFAKGSVTDYPLTIRHRNGHLTDVLYNASLYRDVHGDTLGVFAAARDVTERNKAERKVALLNLQNRLILDSAGEGIYGMDMNGRCTFVNPAASKLLGFAVEELIGQSSHSSFHHTKQDGSPYLLAECPTQIAREQGRIYRGSDLFWRKDGSSFPVELISTPIFEAGKITGAVVAFSDITERKRAENAIKEKEERLTLATVKNGVGVWDWNLVTQEMIWDDSMYMLYHIRREDFIGTEEAWRASLHPDDLTRGDQEVADAIADKKPFETEFRVIWPSGEIRYIKAVAKVFRDEQGKPLRMLGINMDVTERSKAEEEVRKLNRDLEQRVVERTAQLETANKELEAFSYSVSHDLRTPLRAIDGFSRIVLDEYQNKLDDEGKRLLNVVRDNTNRMSQLIDDILKFSRTGRVEISYAEIDMEKMAHEVFEELQPAIAGEPPQLEIEHIPPIRGDQALLHQVFINLLSNAIKFSRNSTPAKIKVGGAIEGGEAVYYVQDNGAGFDMRYLDKLFGVFQRLHSVGEFEGTGIGLAIVKRIITRHDGRVWAEGKIGEGATIYFALPTKEKRHE
ncbi:MAG: PAS domain S-box protein [Nitrosomonadales bacterium]|nr:PAS domain S-box protein [Nitrosomonadales bacterium]